MLKKAIRKIAPIAASAVMLGSTAGFAAAADLADYPGPFVTASKIDVAIVLGADAESIDVIGSNDIIGSLVVPISGGTVDSVSGGDTKDLPMNKELNDGTYGWSSVLTDSKVPALQDTEIAIDIGDVSDDYSVHDEIEFSAALVTETGLTATNPDEDFKDNVFLEVGKKSAVYKYIFDENLKKGNYIANATSDEPITVKVLGKELEIRAAADSDKSITVLVGDESTLKVGESTEVVGKTIKLVNVGSGGAVVISVDGAEETISSGSTEKVSGIRIKNDETFYSTTFSERQATLVVGEDTTKTYKNGDEYIGEDEDDPDWIWQLSDLGGTTTSKPKINVTFDQTWRSEDEVIYIGGSLEFPEGFVKVSPLSLTEPNFMDYIMETDETELRNSTGGSGADGLEGSFVDAENDYNVLKIYSTEAEDSGIKLPASGFGDCANLETDVIYIYANDSSAGMHHPKIYAEDPDDAAGSPKYCGSAVGDGSENFNITLQYDDSSIIMYIVNASSSALSEFYIYVTKYGSSTALGQNISLKINKTNEGIKWTGIDDGDSKATDVIIGDSGGSPARNIGTWEEDTMTLDGIKIYDPDSNENTFKFAIPSDEGTDFRVNVAVTGEASTRITSGSQYSKPPTGVSVLDTEITTVSDKNLIVVGGSAVNRVAAKLLGLSYPTYGGDAAWQDATGVSDEGQAIVKLVDSPYATDKVAMLVAGWSGTDTRRASKALATGVPALSGESANLVTTTEQVTVQA